MRAKSRKLQRVNKTKFGSRVFNGFKTIIIKYKSSGYKFSLYLIEGAVKRF